ncbi:hypothetical protein [Desulfoscipio geothermicus]|uniref:Uncharacterized protein n=1 Tax=Desulfoscipio geothermicus DSM 3669 TaxID=1121426 RepID=A0A1I6ED28_9FIRM|nr:hypothetical protein [Desulfoscipio geothermicus]SFR15650.1 hypothetical protein SAMN05660706_13628 [Desulfoscipio geothermicus DSM 3669]
MHFREIDESSARHFFAMLKDAPSILEVIEQYPGVDNLMHVLTAQLATYFVLPFLENQMGCEDLVEAFRRYLFTAFAFGLIMRDNDMATRYVMDLYERGCDSQGEDKVG